MLATDGPSVIKGRCGPCLAPFSSCDRPISRSQARLCPSKVPPSRPETCNGSPVSNFQARVSVPLHRLPSLWKRLLIPESSAQPYHLQSLSNKKGLSLQVHSCPFPPPHLLHHPFIYVAFSKAVPLLVLACPVDVLLFTVSPESGSHFRKIRAKDLVIFNMSVVDGVVVLVPPPPGYNVDFDNPQRQADVATYWLAGFGLVFAMLFTAQRVYVKLVVVKRFQLDDCTFMIYTA